MNNPLSDNAIREQAMNPRLCCVVQAPAGSGKTELLIQRILVLLAEVERPEEILAITFTKKAAGEMRTRVLKALHEAEDALPADASEHLLRQRERARAALQRDRERGWNLLQQPARLGIQTIDSLCASLAARLPLTAGFGAPSVIAPKPEALYAEAATEVLKRIEDDADNADVQALETLLPHLGNHLARVRDLLANMLGKRDQWLRHVMRGDRAALEGALQRLVEDELRTLGELFPKALRKSCSINLATLCANLQQNGVPDSDPRMSWQVPGWPEPSIHELTRWQGLAEHLLTQGGTWRKSLTKKEGLLAPSEKGIDAQTKAERKEAKERMEELLGALADAPALESALHACRDIPAPRYPERDWRVLDALLHLLKLAVAELNVSFGAQGMVDFVENALAAQRALGEEDEASELWLALDYRLRHILIDEFQDTSTTQFELLKRLTAGWQAGEDAFTEYEGRSLFLVGDPMQSIYRFREAEVGLFLLAQRAGVGQLRIKRLELCTNFRSQAGIVAWVNRVFAEVLPQSDDLDIGAVRYAEPPAVAFHTEAEGAAVRLHFLPKADARNDALHVAGDEDSESAPAERGRAEAERVIEQVREALATLLDDGTHMKAADRSVAILVRSRSHLAQIIPVLRAAGIAFQAVEIEQLAERPMVHDLMALTRALLHPADRIAWLAVLRAPWCGLRLADLLALVEDQPKSAVWTLLHDAARLECLTPDARARLLHVREVLAAAQAASGRSSLRRQVEGAWLALGGAACAQQARELDEAGIFFDLLDTLHDEQGGVIEVAELEQRLTRLFAPPDSPTPGTPPVQVMTIHKSKGLQFHTVILPGLARTPPNPDSPLLLWREREAASAQGAHPNLLLAPIKAAGDDKPSKKAPPSLYRWLQKMEAARERYETGRLLYVATTRAIQRLHLIAEVPQDKDGAWKAPARSLLGSLWPGIQTDIQLMQENAPPALARQTVESEDVSDTPQAAASATILRRLAQIGTAPRPPAGIVVQSAKRAAKPSSHSAQNDEDTYPNAGTQLGASDETPRHIGTLLHRLFERIAHDGLAVWDARLKEDASATLKATLGSTLRRELLRLGVGAQRLEEAVESVLSALVSTLNDPRGRWILDAHEVAQCEWALGGLIDGQPISAIIDRSFIDQGTRWIIDYKTAAPAAAWGENMDSFLDGQYTLYSAQLESYAALLRNIEPEREIRLGLYFPMLARWLEWSVNDY